MYLVVYRCTYVDTHIRFVVLLFYNDVVTGLHDIDEYIQSQLLLAVSVYWICTVCLNICMLVYLHYTSAETLSHIEFRLGMALVVDNVLLYCQISPLMSAEM